MRVSDLLAARAHAPAGTTRAATERLLPAGAWARAWAEPRFRARLLAVLVLLVGGLVPLMPTYFHLIQQRPGALLPDPLLALLPRADVGQAIFLLMYGSVLAALAWLARHPVLLARGLWAYTLLLLLRMLTIWLCPLVPPLDMLPLPDPFTAYCFHAEAEVITKDLFFSGHTATVVLLALAVRGRAWRAALVAAAIAVGGLVLVQRVHYSYDVLAAPLFAWLAYWLAGRVTRGGVGRGF